MILYVCKQRNLFSINELILFKEGVLTTPLGGSGVKIAGWGSYTPHPVHPVSGTVGVGVPMKFHDGVGGGGVMAGYHHHNLMDMYPGPAINTMDWKNTSQVS